MGKIIELKKQLDTKLEDVKIGLVGIVAMIAVNVISLVMIRIFDEMFGYGFIYVFLGIVKTLITTLANVVAMYILHYYTLKKPVINFNKYAAYILGICVYVLLNRVGNGIINGTMNDVLKYTFQDMIGITKVINNLGYLFATVSSSFYWYGFFFAVLMFASMIISTVTSLVYPAGIIVPIVLDMNPELLKSTKMNYSSVKDVPINAQLACDSTVGDDVLTEEKIAENFVEGLKEEKIDEGETPLSNEMVSMFLMSHSKYFPAEKMILVRQKLENVSQEDFLMLSALNLKDPTTMLLISIFLGGLGIDRFMLGDTGMGVLKLLTGGCCGVLTIIDWFTISKKTKEKNFLKFMQL